MPRGQHGTQPHTVTSQPRAPAAWQSSVLRLRFAGAKTQHSTRAWQGLVLPNAEPSELLQLTPAGRSLLSVFHWLVWWPLTP